MSLTPTQLRRYARHVVLDDIGEAGQQTLIHAHVAVLGCGGLGSVAAGYLAAMGIGHLHLIDHDRVELSNLQRQILFEQADIGQPKTLAARHRIEEINPDCCVTTHATQLNAANAAILIQNAALVIDASDNFASRLALHQACLKAKKPLVYAAISGFDALLTTFKGYQPDQPCLHCLMPNPPQRERDCKQEGIIGALAGVIGSMQALEAVKELLHIGESLTGRLLRYNSLNTRWNESVLLKDSACPTCGK